MDHQIKSNQIFGSPNRFLPRSGGELQQQSLHEVRAWQKDIIKYLNCDLNLAVAWCINAKNSLSSILGFFPYQLAIGTSLKLPFLTNNSALALTPLSKVIVKQHL